MFMLKFLSLRCFCLRGLHRPWSAWTRRAWRPPGPVVVITQIVILTCCNYIIANICYDLIIHML